MYELPIYIKTTGIHSPTFLVRVAVLVFSPPMVLKMLDVWGSLADRSSTHWKDDGGKMTQNTFLYLTMTSSQPIRWSPEEAAPSTHPATRLAAHTAAYIMQPSSASPPPWWLARYYYRSSWLPRGMWAPAQATQPRARITAEKRPPLSRGPALFLPTIRADAIRPPPWIKATSSFLNFGGFRGRVNRRPRAA